MNDIENILGELNNLPEGLIVMLETSVEKILNVSLLTIKILSDKKTILGLSYRRVDLTQI